MKCSYCGADMAENERLCPQCGAWNGVPKTIEELRQFCQAYQLPLERMRFFVGEDYREPRAFGIFRAADGTFVVYKNKDDGTRAIRYQGPDEAFAVNELYQKMKSEVELRQAKQAAANAPAKKSSPAQKALGIAIALVVIALISLLLTRLDGTSDGYYYYDDDYYYYQGNDWYLYGPDGWYLDDQVDDTLTGHPGDYYRGSTYDGDYGVQDFSNSPYYQESDSSSSSDVFDSWDSNDTDWSSDW